jgi:CheY-like chemotaxis protein
MSKQNRILIVEDQEDMQTIYESYFENEPAYEITIVSDGQEAIRKLDECEFDLVVMDIIMEPMSGDTLFVYLKSVVETKDLPIIVVSVLGPEFLEGFRKIEKRVEFLQKPIVKKALFERIESMIG